MEQNDTSLLREIHKLTKENNTMLRRLEQSARRARFWKMLRIGLILALLLGAYYFVQPFIENLTTAYTSIQNSFQELQDTKDAVRDFNPF